jgi:murein DD-endopeptidase MepM/ murein hydrolase activator NlpD
MFKKGFNTYKIGRLTINVFTNDIVLIYIGKNGTHIRNIYKKDFFRISKAIAMTMCFIAITSLIIAAIPSTEATAGSSIRGTYIETANDDDNDTSGFVVYTDNDIKNIEEDENLKNQLLLSDKTDFSLPTVNVPLKIRTHKVKTGESLNGIAKKYGVSIDTICGSNNLKSYDYVDPGITLRIPNKDGILTNIKEGDSIAGFASKYKVPVEKILAENNFRNSDFISKGELVFIPDAKPQNIFSGFLWPVGGRKLTSGYGVRLNPFNREYNEFHKGIDIVAKYEWVRSTKYGKVTFAGWMSGYGYAVIIAHPGGWKSLYAHLSRISVQEGQYVKQGQNIAKSGNTGRSTGPHLHFELIKDGKHTNPRKYLKK